MKILYILWSRPQFKLDLKISFTLFCILYSFLGLHANTSSPQKGVISDYNKIAVSDLSDVIESKAVFNSVYLINNNENNRAGNSLKKNFKDAKVGYNFFGDQVFLGKDKSFLTALNGQYANTAQEDPIEVTGTVTDSEGLPLPGVNVTIEGTSKGTTTDFDGNYEIEVEKGQTLNFSSVGFTDQTKTVGDTNTVEVVMEEGQQSLEQVIVSVGYGSQRIRDNTSSISSVKSEDIVRTRGTPNVGKAIQGKIPGVQITTSDRPGSTPTTNIRGIGTVLSGREPLYVVDGLFTDNLDNINPEDIASFDVLKDASALAIYGNRAANGAIIVTTKSGKQKLSVNYSGSIGMKTPINKVNMANSEQYVNYMNIAAGETRFAENQPYNTDWFDELTRIGVYQKHNIQISGSSESVKYFFSAGNYNEKGITRGEYYNRTSLRSNNEFKISDAVKLTQNINATFTKENPNPYGAIGNPYRSAAQLAPIFPVRYKNGEFGGPVVNKEGIATSDGAVVVSPNDNPLALIDQRDIRNKGWRFQNGTKLDIDFSSFVNGLKFTSQFNAEYRNHKNYEYDNGKRIIGFENQPSFDNQITNRKDDKFNWMLSNYFNYGKTIGDHRLDFTLGTEYSYDSGYDITLYVRENIERTKDYWNLNGVNYADNTSVINSINENDQKTLSYFGRLQYKFKNRYLVTGTFRKDGSSQFSSGNKWGNFPSLGLGWILTEENFLKNSDFIDNLKIRGGWGRLGNQNIPLNIPTFATGSEYRYSFDADHIANGTTVDQAVDPSVSWEITEETSIGVDFELLDRRLSGTLDYYDKKTTNIILESKPLSAAGINLPAFSHMGQVSNKGFEVSLSWADKVGNGDFSYAAAVNFSTNNNKLDKLIGDNVNIIQTPARAGTIKYFGNRAVGQPLGSFYLWKTDGYDDQGSFKYVDTNGNGKTGKDDADDRQFMGSYIPKQTLGLSLNFGYKNWDLAIDTYGAFGGKVFNGELQDRVDGENITSSMADDFWTPDNTDAAHPAPSNSQPTPSDYFLESADYFRVNTIELGYTVENPFKFISSFRIYFNANNPLMFQSFSGYNPEPNPELSPYEFAGVEQDAYPVVSSYSIGLNLIF